MLVPAVTLAVACSKANPAFRSVSRGSDDGAAEENPPGLTDAGEPGVPIEPLPDAAASPDLAEDPDVDPPDLASPFPADGPAPVPDLAPASPDLASLNPDLPRPAPDVAPDLVPARPDLARDTAPPPIADLVAHWRFDTSSNGTSPDATGNLNTARLRNAMVTTGGGFTGAKFTNPGTLSLDGNDDYVDLDNRNLPRNEADKTISVWIRADNPAGIPIRTVVSLADVSSQSTGLQLGLDGGRCATWIFGQFRPLLTGKSIDGNWHHLAVTYDSGQHTLYCDGAMSGTINRTAAGGAVTNARVGTWQPPEEMFDGAVDDLRIYARALTAAEIMRLAGGSE